MNIPAQGVEILIDVRVNFLPRILHLTFNNLHILRVTSINTSEETTKLMTKLNT